MNKNERLGLFILKSELNRCKIHTQKCLDYIGVVAQLQNYEDMDIARESQQEQLDCHMGELNHSFEQLEMVIGSEWSRQKSKIEKDMCSSLTKKKKTAKI